LWARRKADSQATSQGVLEEYYIGGRTMGGFVLAMTIIASYTSASSFVGGPGVAYRLGLSWVLTCPGKTGPGPMLGVLRPQEVFHGQEEARS
jgi:Na+(H+)/acetate symporter ActP